MPLINAKELSVDNNSMVDELGSTQIEQFKLEILQKKRQSLTHGSTFYKKQDEKQSNDLTKLMEEIDLKVQHLKPN